MLFMTERKITLRLGTNKTELENYIILLPCLFQCFETATKTATTSMFKIQHMPQMFLQWLFTSGVKLYCSIARFITPASSPQKEMYIPERLRITAHPLLLKNSA